MAKRKYGNIKFGKIISYVLLLCLLCGMIGAVAFFTNGFTTDFQTFYVKQGDIKFFESASGFNFPQGDNVRFDVEYTFGKANKNSSKDYDVYIFPNITKETPTFDYIVDGQIYSWSGKLDLSEVFNIKKNDTFFTVDTLDISTMQELLNKLYADQGVQCPDITINKDYFNLVVASYNGKSTVEIAFSPYTFVKSVNLAESELRF